MIALEEIKFEIGDLPAQGRIAATIHLITDKIRKNYQITGE